MNRAARSLWTGSFLSAICFVTPGHAAFLDNGATARIAALGASYVALADDAAALTMNPAGLSLLTRAEGVADYSQPYSGLTDGTQITEFFAGYARPMSRGRAWGVAWKEIRFDTLYKERTFTFAYSSRLNDRLTAGFCLKQMHHSFRPDRQVVDDFGNVQAGNPDLFARYGTSREAYSADLGLLYRVSATSRWGISVQDLNEPDTALAASDRDPIHRTVRIGAAVNTTARTTWLAGMATQSVLAAERDWIGTIGAEHRGRESESGQASLRASVAIGNRSYRQAAFGSGWRVGVLQLDYAFAFLLTGLTLGSTYGSHRVSITYRFGRPKASSAGQGDIVMLQIED